MWAFYQNRDDPAQMESLWVLEMILMIAIGTLFDANPVGNDEFSGVALFDYAHRNLPTLSDLRFNGKLGIEIYALFAIYLGNMNRKEEAYLYVGEAKCKQGSLTNSQFVDQHRHAVGNLTKVSQSLRNETLDAVGEGSYESSLVDYLHARKVDKPRQRLRSND